jgi:hypothetical protein
MAGSSEPPNSSEGPEKPEEEKNETSRPEKPEEENNPVPNRMAPRNLPGVYMVLCLENNKRYYGQSGNVSGRLSAHKSRLRAGTHEVKKLQDDFNTYGEVGFEFTPIWMKKDSTPTQRLAIEAENIARFHEICYNRILTPDRKGSNNPFFGRRHSPETLKIMSRVKCENNKDNIPEGLAINLNGTIYPSMAEASRKTNHSRDTIRRWLRDPKKTNCVPVDLSPPENADQSSEDGPKRPEGKNPKENLNKNAGIAKKVSIYGETFESMSAAARHRNCSSANIARLIRKNPNECFFVDK